MAARDGSSLLLQGSRFAATPCRGRRGPLDELSGGIAALNHRLMAGKPPAWHIRLILNANKNKKFRTGSKPLLDSASQRSASAKGRSVTARPILESLRRNEAPTGCKVIAWGNAPGNPKPPQAAEPQRGDTTRVSPRWGSIPVLGRYLGRCPRLSHFAPLGLLEFSHRTFEKASNIHCPFGTSGPARP